MIVNVATAQIAGVLAAMGVLVASPPRDGVMLLVPLDVGAPVAAIAVAHGARIVARGPIEGSVVVRGRLADLAAPLVTAAILPLAASSRLCGRDAAR